ncbi:MAG: hypothetical protein H7A45_16200 [Verrucomicrobiales bacterium]|nr:hypothetical protein [Verrucomicrobiales bacterium]MCP5527963.1 hypothetical protein [Verrucomicrobiales bacterium]
MLFAGALSVPAALGATDEPAMLVVVGVPGEPDYATNFLQQATLWREAAETARVAFQTVGWGPTEEADDRDRVRAWLTAQSPTGPAPLWIVLIGHGTFDGKEARFNLRGPDLTASEFAEWLTPVSRPMVFLNTASASAPFMARLTGSARVIVTATRSGYEQNYARFGEHLARTIADPAADLDKDGQTSVLEAFLSAAARVAEFYQSEGRLATEHALIDDNGDGLGTAADWFRGVRAIKQATEGAAVDGDRAHQIHLILSPAELALPPETRARRDALELDVLRLRDRKASVPEADYYRELERLLLELARVYEKPSSAVQ